MKKIKKALSKKRIIAAGLAIVFIYTLSAFLFHLFPFHKQYKIPKPRNIVLIVVDTLRADRLGFMGYQRETSPNLDRAAAEGFVFRNFYSQSGWTMPSVASIVTGMLPAFHRVENYQDVLGDDEATLAEMLKIHGYKTVGLSANSIISKEAGFAQGFDLWKNIEYDDCITRRAESYLDPALPTPEEVEKDNLLDFNAFRYMCIERRRLHGIQPGYFDKGRFEIKPGDFGPSSEIYITGSSVPVPPGEYRYGVSMMSDVPGRTADVIIREKGKDGAVLSRKKIDIPIEWKMFSAKIDLSRKMNIELVISISPSGSGSVYVDTPFLLPGVVKERESVFLYLHYMEVHEPNKISKHLEKKYLGLFKDDLLEIGNVVYPPGDPNRITSCRALFPRWKEESDSLNWHNNRYDETVRFMDDQAGMIIDTLKRSGAFDDSLVLFTADHGQEFFDHGWTGHGYSLYNELIHIPMLMIYPRLSIENGSKIIQKNVQAIDILPTVEALAEGSMSPDNDTSQDRMGRSLLPLLLETDPDWSEAPVFSSDIRNRISSIILKNWKYIKKDSACLSAELFFDIFKDAGEKNPVAIKTGSDMPAEDFRLINKKHNELVKSYQARKKRKTLPADRLNTDKLAQLGYINPHYITEVGQDIDCFMVEMRMIILFLNIYGVR